MDKPDDSLSLINHCKVCPNSCCNNGIVITTEKNHDEIIATGAKDHFHRIDDNGAISYINKFTACGYLDDRGYCSIENNKPLTCKTYPVMPDPNAGFIIKRTGCGAATSSTAPAFALYVIQARNLIRKEMTDARYDQFGRAFEIFENRNDASLKEQGIIVTPPPAYNYNDQ